MNRRFDSVHLYLLPNDPGYSLFHPSVVQRTPLYKCDET